MKKIFNQFGPGVLVTAAFIGPGTVTVCTLAGRNHQMSLLWVMVFAIISTIVLQEMSLRLGLITQKGLAVNIRGQIRTGWIKSIAMVLIFSSIVVGNLAYEAGNISGSALGLSYVLRDINQEYYSWYAIAVGMLSAWLLFSGNYKLIERVLIGLVGIMSVAFIIAALLSGPNIMDLIAGLFIPSFPQDSFYTIMGLIGTTVVPYNLFLHASMISSKWTSTNALPVARKDNFIAIVLGGIISCSIIICGAAGKGDAVNLAEVMKPALGTAAYPLLGMGLFTAGLTSAITAPLAAALVAQECFNWEDSLVSNKFRVIWALVILSGLIVSVVGYKPVDIIRFAQALNAVLLPVVAGFLIWMMNQNTFPIKFRNNIWNNIIGILVLAITLMISIRSFEKIFNLQLF
jgi:manganese transport protein